VPQRLKPDFVACFIVWAEAQTYLSACGGQGGELVAEGFAGAGGHDEQDVAASGGGFADLLLVGAEVRVAEDPVEEGGEGFGLGVGGGHVRVSFAYCLPVGHRGLVGRNLLVAWPYWRCGRFLRLRSGQALRLRRSPSARATLLRMTDSGDADKERVKSRFARLRSEWKARKKAGRCRGYCLDLGGAEEERKRASAKTGILRPRLRMTASAGAGSVGASVA
jgi:hypothetical protein